MADRDLLPKPTVMMPSNRSMPFGPSGVLLPDGPEYPPMQPAPDLAGLPWQRELNQSWTTLEQRSAVLRFLRLFFHEFRPEFVAWKVVERDHLQRMSAIRLSAPLLDFTLFRRNGGKIEATIEFPHDARFLIDEFRVRLADLRTVLLALKG